MGDNQRRHHVVIIGAGFGGLNAAKALGGAPLDVTVVDANNYHLFQPLLYQVATAGLDDDDVAYPTRAILRRYPNVSFRLGRASGIDAAARRVQLADGTTLDYDQLVIAAGAVTNTFGTAGAEDHAIGLKNLGDAIRVRQHILRRYEAAVTAQATGTLNPRSLSIAIVGGGPTGVELAGGLQELLARVLRRDFPSLPVEHATVTLIEMNDRLLGSFSPRSSASAEQTLRERGVDVELGTSVERIEPGAVVLDSGRRVEAGTVIWAAGVQAAALAKASGLPLGKAGRIEVDDALRVPTHPEIWVVGDLAAASDGEGGLLPQVAQVAIQSGRHAGRGVAATVRGDDVHPFRYKDKGSMATIGRRAAVGELPLGLHLRGSVGWFAWLGLHLLYLIGFRNRVNVLVNWTWNYFTYDHGSRLLESDEDPEVREVVAAGEPVGQTSSAAAPVSEVSR